jgi:hypothetical protein
MPNYCGAEVDGSGPKGGIEQVSQEAAADYKTLANRVALFELNAMNSSKAELKKPPVKRANILLRLLGPGLVTGAADDDPSGIATYTNPQSG